MSQLTRIGRIYFSEDKWERVRPNALLAIQGGKNEEQAFFDAINEYAETWPNPVVDSTVIDPDDLNWPARI